MTGTPHLGLPLLAAAQAQKHVTHNEALALIDALAQIALAASDIDDPPVDPAPGMRVLVGEAPTGAFAGQAGRIALFDAGAWRFLAPQPGWLAWIVTEAALVVFDGADWIAAGASERVELLGIATDADETNRLALKSDAALFAARDDGDGDFRLVMNKTAPGDSVSQVFQSGWSGRAEMGLTGDDDFRFKVSPDGGSWFEAIRIDRASGLVTFPAGIAGGGGSAGAPNLLINGAMSVNQRGFAGGALAAGTYGFDRWRAGAGGATVARATDGTITLSGPLEQVIEAPGLAGAALTLSLEDPDADVAVTVGAQSATIPAGSGRRAATVTLGAGETGDILVRLTPAGTGTFRRVRLEAGTTASPWPGERIDVEMARCQRYYQLLPSGGGPPQVAGVLTQRVVGNIIDIPVTLPVAMRATPLLRTSTPAWSNGAPSGNQIGNYDNAAGGWTTMTGSLTVTTAATPGKQAAILRFQASTSFSGASGGVGNLYLGTSARIAFDAEF